MWRLLGLGLLMLLVVSSAVQVVLVKHESRRLFAELQSMMEQRDRLLSDWGRLQLEESTFGAHRRVEAKARSEFDMQIPTNKALEIVVIDGP